MANLVDLDRDRLVADLDGDGFAITGPLLTKLECPALLDNYDDDGLF